MKAHVGVDAASGLVHSVVGTAANESDLSQAHALLHGHEEHAFGDAGYTGVDKREEMQSKTVKWQVAVKRGKIKALRDGAVKDLLIAVARAKAQIRARVEHPFHVIKNLSVDNAADSTTKKVAPQKWIGKAGYFLTVIR